MGDITEIGRPRFRAYKTTRGKRKIAKARRDAAREIRHCVNENSQGTHGPATHGVRCLACYETHKRSA